MPVTRKMFLSVAAGVLLSAAGFYFAFRSVPFDLLVESLADVNYLWVIPGAAIGLASFAVRALRWRVILGSTLKLPFGSAFHSLMIGFMINSVLPGRVGELARPAIIKKQDNVPFSLGLTTIAAERLLDAVALMVLFAGVLATVHIDPAMEIEFRGRHLDAKTLDSLSLALTQVSIILAAAAGAVSIPAVQRFLKAIIMKAPLLLFSKGSSPEKKVREKISLPMTRVLDHVVSGLSMLRQPVNIFLCLVYSFAIWLMQALSLYVLTFGFPGLYLGFGEMTTVFIIICFFIMLPSVPGYWGLWEAGGVFAMALFGVGAELAAGFSIISHIMLIVPVIAVGIFSAAVTGVNIFRITRQEPVATAQPHGRE
ncbi:MAG: lysylphosphatidylglycerol synthase transmembrane domain-containing protein [Desulfobacterales bacterium]